MAEETIDNTQQFRRILARNVALPLFLSVMSAAVFIGIIAYLLNVLSGVERSEQVIAKAYQSSKLAVDMERLRLMPRAPSVPTRSKRRIPRALVPLETTLAALITVCPPLVTALRPASRPLVRTRELPDEPVG